MKRHFLIILGLFLISTVQAGAFASDVVCADGFCSYDNSLDVQNESSTNEFTQFEIRDVEDDLNVLTPNGSSPRSTKFFMTTENGEPKNLTLSLPSAKKLNNAGSIVAIGSTVDNLSVNLNGRQGDATANASKVCADKVIAGDYGTSVKSRFLLARYADPALPMDRCVSSDLISIQNNEFGCDSGQAENNGTLVATRWLKRRQCEAKSARRMCVGRTMTIRCTWVAERFTPGSGSCSAGSPNGTSSLNPKPRGGGRGPGLDWECVPTLASATASGWRLQFPEYRVAESYVQSRRLAGKTDENICDELTGRNDSYLEGFPDIASHEMYFTMTGETVYKGNVNITDGQEFTVIKSKWVGKHSSSSIGNPHTIIAAPANTIFMDGTFKPCMTSGMHFDTHLWDVSNVACDFPIQVQRSVIYNVQSGGDGYTECNSKTQCQSGGGGLSW